MVQVERLLQHHLVRAGRKVFEVRRRLLERVGAVEKDARTGRRALDGEEGQPGRQNLSLRDEQCLLERHRRAGLDEHVAHAVLIAGAAQKHAMPAERKRDQPLPVFAERTRGAAVELVRRIGRIDREEEVAGGRPLDGR